MSWGTSAEVVIQIPIVVQIITPVGQSVSPTIPRRPRKNMKVYNLSNYTRIRPHKLPADEVPHLVIETNKTCNVMCADCYSLDRDFVKSLDEVKAEIDLGMQKRNLESISLLGGEPTLHPDIVEIVKYVKSKRLTCILLTNGLKFLQDKTDSQLDALLTAGLDRVLVHMDEGQQHVHESVDEARQDLFQRLDQKKIYFAISATVRAGDEDSFTRLLLDNTKYRLFDGVLATLAVDIEKFYHRDAVQENKPSLRKLCENISRSLHVDATTYIPSSLDDDEVAWVMYMYYINAESGHTFGLSPEVNAWFRKLYRRLYSRHLFAQTSDPRFASIWTLLCCGFELLRHPGRLAECIRLFRRSRLTRDIRFQSIVLQHLPRYNVERDQVEICYHCPDATIRNGRITPVCIADQLNPLGDRAPHAPQDVIDAIYQHLEEQ